VWRPVAGGPWPIIVFSHGYEVGPGPYEMLLQAWASAGYVVAAPEFPLTDQAIAGAGLDENDIQNQPADVRFVLDTLVASASPVAADIDASRVVYAGHSDGAETALAASLAPTPAGEPAPRAVLCMSVSPLNGVTSTANPPVLVTQGDGDTTNQPDLGMQTYAEAAGPKYYLDILGGDHLPPLEAGSRWLAAIEGTTLAFFHLYLYGGDPAAVVEAGSRPGLTTIRVG
jgi:dienelactone hydrolase